MDKYYKLKKWLGGLQNIPKKEERKRTLMDIMGIDHLETHWSQIYAYFFNTKEDHKMGNLFIRALFEVCEIDMDFLQNPFVMTEYTCKDGKRIDILLVESKHAVIIENKVYHVLDNDLKAYYDDVKDKYGCDDIKIVVLGLQKYKVENFNERKILPVSITHIELMNRIKEEFDVKRGNYKEESIYLFEQFYQNIKNMANETVTNELEFFESCNLEERIKIYEIAKIYNNLIFYLDKKMKCKSLEIDGEKLIGKHENDYVKYVFDGTNDNMMLTILYKDRLLVPDKGYNKSHILIILELQGSYRTTVKQEDFMDYFKNGIEPSNAKGDNWIHFAYYVQDIEIKEAFENLNIKEYIKNSGLIELAKIIRFKCTPNNQ